VSLNDVHAGWGAGVGDGVLAAPPVDRAQETAIARLLPPTTRVHGGAENVTLDARTEQADCPIHAAATTLTVDVASHVGFTANWHRHDDTVLGKP
jgi:hypothetical protein